MAIAQEAMGERLWSVMGIESLVSRDGYLFL
jgi:hypothetical protein